MSLTVTSRIHSGVVIVDVVGRLSFLDVSLREHFEELLEEGHRTFVLNLADVPYVDSFGLGQLITILTAIRNKGGHLILLGLADHVRTLFQITRLNTVFNISTQETDAVTTLQTKAVEPPFKTVSFRLDLS